MINRPKMAANCALLEKSSGFVVNQLKSLSFVVAVPSDAYEIDESTNEPMPSPSRLRRMSVDELANSALSFNWPVTLTSSLPLCCLPPAEAETSTVASTVKSPFTSGQGRIFTLVLSLVVKPSDSWVRSTAISTDSAVAVIVNPSVGVAVPVDPSLPP